MHHQPSDDSPNEPPSGQAVVAGVAPAQRLRHSEASARAETAPSENSQSAYHLNPSLQQALGCLDIKLADELNRFRSQQAEYRYPDMQVEQVNEVNWEQQSADFDADAEILTAEIIQSAGSNSKAESQCSEADNGPTSGFIIIDGLTTSASSSRNAITTVNYAPISVHRQDLSATHESLDLNFATGGEIAPFQDEYSSSSQELLRQIQSGYPSASEIFTAPTQSQPTPKRKYLTPLKIGSMAAACVLAGGAAYTYVNPSILATLTATKVATPTATTNSIEAPNLAANEFTQIDLSTINTIKLPTTATATNVSTATTATPTVNAATTAAATTTPTAIPFNGIAGQSTPPATITSQPKLADSLVKSLLPPNFQTIKPVRYRAIQPGRSR